MRTIGIVLSLSVLFVSASAFGADPGGGSKPELTVEPQRSYGSINVILYQTSW